MMTSIRHLLCILSIAALTAACDQSDVFYSTAYDIVRVEIDVELETAATPDPDDGSGEETGDDQTGDEQMGDGVSGGDAAGGDAANCGTPGRGTNETNDGVAGGEQTEDEVPGGEQTGDDQTGGGAEASPDYRALIAEEAANWAPVHAGGGYLIDYTRYDGGPLRVRTSADSGTIEGVFLRTPGTDAIGFVYDGRMRTYTLATYGDEQGRIRTLLQVDLTEHFRARYPDAGIVRVLRLEYTSHE